MSDPALIRDPAILEAAAQALDNCIEGYQAIAVLAAVTPLIRAAALEEAASMAEEYFSDGTISGVSPQWVADEIAAMLRALKEQP